jgi:hypothetical protein
MEENDHGLARIGTAPGRVAQVDVLSLAVRFARHIATRLVRWPFALAACLLLAAALLLPGLGRPGLWEPHERQLADRIAPPGSAAGGSAAGAAATAKPPPPRSTPPRGAEDNDCVRAVPADAEARTLTARAMKWGRDTFADSDGGRRLPLALLGLLTVLAAAGTAMRLAGARAGVVTAIVLLAMPLLALQSRMLTSEIGTACAASLIVYGLVALGQLGRRSGPADVAGGVVAGPGGARGVLRGALDMIIAAIALAAGIVLGFYGGGALLGLVVPIGAVAVAGSLGVPLVGAIRRKEPLAPCVVALLATLAVAGLIALLAYQLYDLRTPYPGMTPPPAREVLGKAILPSGCYSWALGGIWRPDDDLRIIFDSMFEQIAYGTYPWGLLAPIAMAALLAGDDPRSQRLGAIALAWAGAAWVAGEVFQRKVGFTVYAGFPALALAIGGWLDSVLARRARGDAGALPPGARLIALFMLLGVVDLGKDMYSFADRVTSLLVGNDAIKYPAQSKLLLPTKAWPLILGAVVAIGFAIAIAVRPDGDSPRDRWWKRFASVHAIIAIAATIAMAVFWTAVWQPRLAVHLSSKAMFESYEALARPGDELVVMGDLGQAPLAYTRKPPQSVPDRTQVIAALGRPGRVFAIAPQTELCTLHREVGGKPYFVIDDRNYRNLLLSNRVDGTTDKNPLRTAIVHEEPRAIRARPKGKVVWDGRIELLGWDLPRKVARGARFDITLYYKILQPVGGSWKSLVHFDGPAGRAGNGDHEPIGGRCPTSTWQPGDYVIDRFTARAGGGAFPAGVYDVWIGFFTGTNPNWRNMKLDDAPGDMRDATHRVKITSIGLE